jgi:hypothetical protein
MSSSGEGQFDGRTMNALADIQAASRFARTIEDAEAKRFGIRVCEARDRVARRLGVPAATLENLRRLRTKAVPNWLMARIRAAFVDVLQTEIRRLEHEITIARQIGMDHRDDDLAAAEAQIRSAKKILTGIVGLTATGGSLSKKSKGESEWPQSPSITAVMPMT